MSVLWTVIQFIIIFSILMIVHEGGHFIMCRIARIPVEEFGLGFPPRVTKLFTWRGTAFTLNAIPFGAFVKPRGELDRSIPDGLANSKPGKKLGVYLGGPIMNVALGMVLFFLLFYQIGAPDTGKVVLFEIENNSPAESAGLLPGDQITAINGIEITSIESVQAFVQGNRDLPMDITVLRNNESMNILAIPRERPPDNKVVLGVMLGYPNHPTTLVGALIESTKATYEQIKGFVLLPSRLIQGTISQEESRIVGIKGIYDMYSSAGQMDAEAIETGTGIVPVFRLYIIATISIALGLTNLLPIPALDGGRIILVLPELLLRRRIPQKVETYLVSISFLALIMLMIFITFQDIINPVRLP